MFLWVSCCEANRAGVSHSRRVLEVGGGLDLLHEPLGPEDRGKLRPQYCDGDLAVVLQLVGQVDVCHATFAQVAFDFVAVGEGGLEAVEKVWHDVLALLATVLE